MTHALNRRQVLAGTVVAAAALPAIAVAAMPEDPILALVDRHVTLWPLCPGDDDEAGNIRWNAEITRLEAEIAETLPTTRAGALAVVRFVAANLMGYADTEWLAPLLTAAADILEREG